MEDISTKTQSSTPKNLVFNLPIGQIIKVGFMLLIFGAIFISLIKFNVAIDQVISITPSPVAIAGGSVVLLALTLMGVPVIPATVVGVAVWWLFQTLF